MAPPLKEYQIINMILAKVKEEGDQEGIKPHTLGVYRASEIGGCPRALQYATLKRPAEKPSPEALLIFKDGHLHHHAVRDLFGKVGTLSHVEMTISKQYKHHGIKLTLTGTCDGVWNGEPIDVKSINTYRFRALDKSFPDEYRNYVYQLHTYLDILGYASGFFIFKDKNTGELKIKRIYHSDKMMEEILDHVLNIHLKTKEKTMIKRPYKVNDWHCKYCPYRLACWHMPMENRPWASRQESTSRAGSHQGRVRG